VRGAVVKRLARAPSVGIFPNTAGENFRKVLERMHVHILLYNLSIIQHKTIPQGVAVKHSNKRGKHGKGRNVFMRGNKDDFHRKLSK